jgi:hypothetical protein
LEEEVGLDLDDDISVNNILLGTAIKSAATFNPTKPNKKMQSRNKQHDMEVEPELSKEELYARQTRVSRAMHRLTDKFASFLSDYRYTMFSEMVYATPHYVINGSDITVRNHLALYLLKNVVNQKINFPDTGRCLVPTTVCLQRDIVYSFIYFIFFIYFIYLFIYLNYLFIHSFILYLFICYSY